MKVGVAFFLKILLICLLLQGCAITTAQLVIDLLEDDSTLNSNKNFQNHRRALEPRFDGRHIENLINLESITIRHKKKKQRSLSGRDEDTEEVVEEAKTKYVNYGSRTGSSFYKKESNIQDVTYWHGLSENRFGFASFTKRGNYSAATFSTSQEIYSFSTLHDGISHVMHVMRWEDMAPRDPLLQQWKYNKNSTSSTSANDKNGRILLRATPAMATTNLTHTDEASFQISLQQLKEKYQQKWYTNIKQRNLAAKTEINILVIASQEATCIVAGRERSCTNPNENPIKTQIEQNLDVLNNAVTGLLVPYKFVMVRFEVSGFPGMKIVAAHEFSKSANYIIKWADEDAADLIMIIMDPDDSVDIVDGKTQEIGGITEPGEEAQSNGYSALNSKYLGAYQFSYNIGRNLGCRPQRYIFDNNERQAPNNFNYAYEQYDDSKSYFRTIMGLQCQKTPLDCPVAPYFSARDFQIYFKDLKGNVSLGGPNNDNARYIVENGKKTANRRSTPVSTSTNDTECFSSSAVVNVLGKGLINMDELKIGDYVQDVHYRGKKQQYHYARVYSFAHFDHDVEGDYLRLDFENKASLEISFNHLLFVIPQGKTQQYLVRAGDVQVGDKFHTNEEKQQDMTVKSISIVRGRGAYAPVTESGTIVVSGVLASSYIDMMGYNNYWLQHLLAQMLLSPLRLICHFNFDFCVNETYNKNGNSEHYWSVVQFLLYLSTNYSPTIQFTLTIIGVPAIIVLYVTEQIIYHTMLVVTMALVTIIFSISLRRKKKTKLD